MCGMANDGPEPAFRPRKSQNCLSSGRASAVVWLELMTPERVTDDLGVVAHRHGFDPATEQSREPLLEFLHCGPGGEPSRAKNGCDCGDFLFADYRSEARYLRWRFPRHGRAAAMRLAMRQCKRQLDSRILHAAPYDTRSAFINSSSQPVILNMPKLVAPCSFK